MDEPMDSPKLIKESLELAEAEIHHYLGLGDEATDVDRADCIYRLEMAKIELEASLRAHRYVDARK